MNDSETLVERMQRWLAARLALGEDDADEEVPDHLRG